MLVDASFGFEMEVFEFLQITKVHGAPRIMGVLTHLDHFKQTKQLQKTKKRLKHRFWTEVDQVRVTLTIKVLVLTIDAQWEEMGDVGSARYEPALLPLCPTIRVLSYRN